MKKIEKHSISGYAIVTFVILFFFGMSYVFFNLGFSTKNLDEQFQNNSETVTGTVISYQYISKKGKGSLAGDRPVIEYTTLNKNIYQHIAIEYGVVNEYNKKKLSNSVIEITYLKDRPNRARVLSWYSSGYILFYFISAFFSFMGIILIYFLRKK